MAIQNRRGTSKDFDASKMLPGEFAVTTDGSRKAYVAFKANDVKELEFKEDIKVTAEKIKEALGYTPADQEDITELNEKLVQETGKLSSENAELKEDLDVIRKKYDNLSDINTDVQQVNINGSYGEVYCDKSTIDVKEGKSYFVYVKFKITNLINWVSGYVYARMLFAVDAGGWEDFYINAIKNDGEYLICYNFTSKTSGKVRVQLYFNNQSPSTNTFSCQCTKLFVAETSDNITELVDSEEQSNTISKLNLKNESVTWENLNDDVKKRILYEQSTNIIDCWGDSLTAGAGSTNYSYPNKLQELVGDSFTVNNYGQGSEVAEAIAFRQGGLNALIGAFTPSTSYVENEMLVSVNGKDLLPTLNYQGTYYGNDTVYIGSTPYFYRRIDNKCMLACLSGNVPSAYTRPMMIRAEGKGTKHILIVCIGQNGWANTDNHTLADIISKMIEHNNYDKYIVVGIPSGSKTSKEEQEKVLSSCFGNHFVNAREYISTYGLSDSNLTPTEEDTSAMSEGQIPPQLLVDTVHMNDYGYIAMANCIYQRGVSLGYW